MGRRDERNSASQSFVALLIIIILVVILGGVSALYLTRPTETQSLTITKEIVPRAVMDAIPFSPQYGQATIRNAWLLFAPSGNGTNYILLIHAEGLSSLQGSGDYFVARGVVANQTIQQVPLGGSIESSRLEVDANGVGNYYVVLDTNPELIFGSIQIARVSGSNSSLVTIIATAALSIPAAG